MSLRWLLFDYVDPELHLTDEQRREIRKIAMSPVPDPPTENAPRSKVHRLLTWGAGSETQPGSALLMATIPIVAMVTMLATWIALVRWIPLLGTLWVIVPLLLGQAAIAWFLLAVLSRRMRMPRVLAALRSMGFNVCQTCGYALRGHEASATQCPECGTTQDHDVTDPNANS